MADEATGAVLHCANCGIPIIRREQMVEVDGRFYPSASCLWLAENPALAMRMRRGGGGVLTDALCGAPILSAELMVLQGDRGYCCPNNAEVARLGELAASQ